MIQINSNIKILEIEHPETWLETCWQIIQEHLQVEYYNDLYEAENIFDFLFENQSEILDSIREQFISHFSYIKAYHATKVTNIETFLTEGIKPLDTSKSNKIIIDFFKTTTTSPKVSHETIINAINRFTTKGNDKTRENLIYFQLYKNELLTCSTQYLLYGSERVLSIISHIGTHNYKKYLKEIGKPTIFHVAVPCEQIININSILLELFSITANYYIYSEFPNKPDLYIKTSTIINPTFILKHEYPDIRNLNDQNIYV